MQTCFLLKMYNNLGVGIESAANRKIRMIIEPIYTASESDQNDRQ